MQIESNLNNDTANFRAQRAALALTQINRPKNTEQVYSGKIKEWKVNLPMQQLIWIFFNTFAGMVREASIR